MKDEVKPLAKDPLSSKCFTYFTTSSSIVFQKVFMNLKVNPSGPGARSLPQDQTELIRRRLRLCYDVHFLFWVRIAPDFSIPVTISKLSPLGVWGFHSSEVFNSLLCQLPILFGRQLEAISSRDRFNFTV
ncbi:hypothetical protein LXL04_023274 [Taraxacum kok-saghyz]